MAGLFQRIRHFGEDRRGTTSVEYVVLAMCIFFAIVTAVTTLGTKLAGVFPAITNQLQ